MVLCLMQSHTVKCQTAKQQQNFPSAAVYLYSTVFWWYAGLFIKTQKARGFFAHFVL